ncbi:MAG: serine/threonine-protein phosphatase [Phycisphaerales bacterium]|nr:serine/threonine-protein phosphatase [Phycisphaerales bacterium]
MPRSPANSPTPDACTRPSSPRRSSGDPSACSTPTSPCARSAEISCSSAPSPSLPSAPAGPVLVVLIDVTGHGIAAAIAVNRLYAELERLTAAGSPPAPHDLIAALNDFACVNLAPQAMFATALVLRVTGPDAPGAPGTVEWAGAGHPPALLRSARTPGVGRLDSLAPMLGVIEADLFACQLSRQPLEAGDHIIVYTDGAIEARDQERRELGIDGLGALLGAGPDPGRTLAQTLLGAVERHRAGSAADDTLIVEVSLTEG